MPRKLVLVHQFEFSLAVLQCADATVEYDINRFNRSAVKALKRFCGKYTIRNRWLKPGAKRLAANANRPVRAN